MKKEKIFTVIYRLALLLIIVIILKFIFGNKIVKIMNNGSKMDPVDDGLNFSEYNGDYLFDAFLTKGGAKNDDGVIKFLIDTVSADYQNLGFVFNGFGCSTISVSNSSGEYIFGRNFDWERSETLIVKTTSVNNYKSISTVNLKFITDLSTYVSKLPDELVTLAAIYAPMDGMNEKGLSIAVNTIDDKTVVDQNTDKPDITTTTAIRLLLDKAATVDEAVELLNNYDMHSSMGLMIHFAVADANGKSAVIEYVDNEMKVIDTKIVTNFYLSQGNKYGVGTEESHKRYDNLNSLLKNKHTLEMDEVRDALKSVIKSKYDKNYVTEWTVIYNQTTKEINYYHRENFDKKHVYRID